MRFAGEFGLEVGQIAAARAGAGGVAALCHEAEDHAVEHHAVVEAVLGRPVIRSTWPGARSGRSLMTTSPPVEG